MTNDTRTIAVTVERTILASPAEAFDAWLDPKIPGNPWNMADKLLLNPTVDGLFYWAIKGTPHYGRFTRVERPGRIEHTWMSPYTSGLESNVTVTFQEKGKDTLMTLVHSGLPDTDGGRTHEKGWNYFLDLFRARLPDSSPIDK
jgi:uncharacterized protein YndB with AHSA1/START domain